MKNNFFKVAVSKLKNALFWGKTIQKPKPLFFRVKKIVFKTKKNFKGSFVPIFPKKY